jgi:hypothetical protein
MMLPNYVDQFTMLWMLAVYFVSPILNIHYISRKAINEERRNLVRKIGGTIYAASLLLTLIWFLSEWLNMSWLGNTLGVIFPAGVLITVLISPVINVFYRIKNATTTGRKIVIGTIGFISYLLLLILVFFTFFVMA